MLSVADYSSDTEYNEDQMSQEMICISVSRYEGALPEKLMEKISCLFTLTWREGGKTALIHRVFKKCSFYLFFLLFTDPQDH